METGASAWSHLAENNHSMEGNELSTLITQFLPTKDVNFPQLPQEKNLGQRRKAPSTSAPNSVVRLKSSRCPHGGGLVLFPSLPSPPPPQGFTFCALSAI